MSRTRDSLVTLQLALSFSLLLRAGLLAQSFANLRTTKLGFDAVGVTAATVALSWNRVGTMDERVRFTDEVLRRLRTYPGGDATHLGDQSSYLLGSSIYVIFNRLSIRNGRDDLLRRRMDSPWWKGFLGEAGQGGGEPRTEWETGWQMVSSTGSARRRLGADTPSVPGGHNMGRELLAGRFIEVMDGPDTRPVAVISETMAEQLFPGVEAVGKRFREMAEHYMAELCGLDETTLTEDDRITVQILRSTLEQQLRLLKHPAHLLPVNQMFSMRIAFVRIGSGAGTHPFESAKDCSDGSCRTLSPPSGIAHERHLLLRPVHESRTANGGGPASRVGWACDTPRLSYPHR